MTRRSALLALPAAALRAAAPTRRLKEPAPYGALPSQRQWRWHQLETYAFLHFSINTFTGKEWGEGDEDPKLFHPTAFDADQIMEALKSAGMKGVILTCKHHDGFCLWPTRTTDHSVRNSLWRGGKGDVVHEVSEAAHRHGLKFGVYLSPWDRNNGAYGKSEYIHIYRRQLTELLTHYGPVFEVWHDGANGGTGYYGGARERRTIDKSSYYDWPNTWALIRKLQPDAVIFSDVGPDVRWVGNEKGFAAETCFETYDPQGEHGGPAAPGDVNSKLSATGTRNGEHWIPPECDVSIRPGWFWHAEENAKVKTANELMDLYFKSVGRGASLLLNVPPDRRGQINEADVRSLAEFGRLRHTMFGSNLAANAHVSASGERGDRSLSDPRNLLDSNSDTYWASEDNIRDPQVTLTFAKPVTFNVIRLREYVRLGQRVDSFVMEADQGGTWVKLAQGTSIGNCRLLQLPRTTTATRIRLEVTNSSAPPVLSELSLFYH
jgi:alpha-L-fucosidase